MAACVRGKLWSTASSSHPGSPTVHQPGDLRQVPALPVKGGACGFVHSASQASVLHGFGVLLPCLEEVTSGTMDVSVAVSPAGGRDVPFT